MEALQKLSYALHPLTDAAWHDYASIWHPFSCDRKTILTRAGDGERWLYFVVSGAQHIFYSDENERQATLLFTYAPSFGGVLDAFLLREPARYHYETITASTFLRASYESLHHLMQQHPCIATMVHIGVTRSMSGLLQRMAELQCFTSEEKFRQLLQRSPHLLGLVPHKYLAAYIGMDPTNFSKMLNRIRI